jgi:hypothetical protein
MFEGDNVMLMFFLIEIYHNVTIFDCCLVSESGSNG